MQKINASISFDQRLFSQDIAGSIAHATMLGECGIIAKSDVRDIVRGLKGHKRRTSRQASFRSLLHLKTFT